MSQESYTKILVVGPTKSGKSTFLSALTHSQSQDYEPTVRASTFLDCDHRLMFIDTPGIDDAIISDLANPDAGKRFSGFENDSMVRELRGISPILSEEGSNPGATGSGSVADSGPKYNIFPDDIAELIRDTLVSIDAILIVTTTDTGALRVARALRYMYYRILQASKNSSGLNQGQARSFQIFMLQNHGDLQRPQLVNWNTDVVQPYTGQDEREQQLNAIFSMEVDEKTSDLFPINVHALDSINALRETGIRKALDDIAAHFHKVIPPEIKAPSTSSALKNTESREECGSCTIA